jgi:hypothetical protein
MNRNVIKFIAAGSMAFDHMAVMLIESSSIYYTIFRIIGRIAFVLFAYMVAEGFFKTKDLTKYFLRLLIFAGLIELFILGFSYYMNDYSLVIHTNVIWPLVFGLLSLILIKNTNIWFRLLAIPIIFLAEFINTPYGAYGVLMIIIFGLIKDPIKQLVYVMGLNLLFIEVPLFTILGLIGFTRYDETMWFQWFSLLAFIFIFNYSGKQGKLNTKWFFYIFYPLHLGIIYLIDILL